MEVGDGGVGEVGEKRSRESEGWSVCGVFDEGDCGFHSFTVVSKP